MAKIIFLSLWIMVQPAHVSFMGVECSPEKGTIKVNLKMNHNDFNYDYRFIVDDDKDFDPSGKIDTTQIFVHQYLATRIRVSADDKELKFRITKLDPSQEEVNLELLFRYNKTAKRFKLQNSILTDLNKKPDNLVIFKYNDLEEGVKFNQDKREHTFIVK